MSWYGVITNAGATLLTSWQQGSETLYITVAKAGSGTVTQSNMKSSTALASYVEDVSIVSAIRDGNVLNVAVQIASAASSFIVHELGIFGKVGSSGTVTLIALHQNDTGFPIPSSSDIPEYVFSIKIPVTVGTTEGTIEASIDDDANIALSDSEGLIYRTEPKYEIIEGRETSGTNKLIDMPSDNSIPVIIANQGNFSIEESTDPTKWKLNYTANVDYKLLLLAASAMSSISISDFVSNAAFEALLGVVPLACGSAHWGCISGNSYSASFEITGTGHMSALIFYASSSSKYNGIALLGFNSSKKQFYYVKLYDAGSFFYVIPEGGGAMSGPVDVRNYWMEDTDKYYIGGYVVVNDTSLSIRGIMDVIVLSGNVTDFYMFSSE